MKNILQILSLCFIVGAAIAEDTPAPPVFQMRVVLDGPTDETEPMVLVQSNKDGANKPQTLHVKKTVAIDQTALQSAFFYIDKPDNSPAISIAFTDKGKVLFAAVTRDCIHKRLAIVIGGQLYSAPVIQEEITGGMVKITGAFTEQEARNLAEKIKESIVKSR